MASRVKVTVQLALYIGPTPIKVWRKTGMRCPLIGKLDGIWGKSKPPVPVDCWVCPVGCAYLEIWFQKVYV